MKTIAQIRIYLNRNRYLVSIIILGFVTALFAEPAFSQIPGKNRKTEKIPQATLKEAKVTARVITTVEEISPMRVKLNVLNPTGKTVRVSILNYENNPVFRDSFTGREYNKILNFTSTPTGRYSLHVNGKKQSETKRFTINSNQERNLNEIAKESNKNSDVMAAIYKTAPTKIMLHLVNNTGEPIDYIFRNAQKEIMHKGIVRNTQFTKVFDMAEANDGKYTMEVKYRTDKAASKTFDMQTVYNRSFAWTDKRYRPLKTNGSSPISQQTLR